MKIGMVGKFPPEEDGMAFYAASLCGELDNAGVEIIKIGDRNSATANYIVDLKSFGLKGQLRRIAGTEKLDMIHIQYSPEWFGAFGMNLALALSQEVPVIVTMHNVNMETNTLKQKIAAYFQNVIARKASAVITDSTQQKEYPQSRNKKRQFHFVRMGHSQNPVHQLQGKNLLFFGELGYGKGAEYAIEAMNYLPDYRLTVAGKAADKHYESLVRKTAAGNRMGNVKLDIRWIPEETKNEYFAKSDIVVLPYVDSISSAVLGDAASYGIPVLATTGAIAQTVKEFVCGRVVEQRSPKAIAAGIKGIYSNYEIYQHGAKRLREEAALEKTAKQHAEIYDEVLQEHYEKHGVIEKEKEQKKMMPADDEDELQEV